MVRFNKTYLTLAILLLLVEVAIALFVHDDFVRPYGGDVLVVILLYCFLKSFLNLPTRLLAGSVLLLAFVIEALQYLNVIDLLGLENPPVFRTILGTSFAWLDILAYVGGTCVILIAEHQLLRE